MFIEIVSCTIVPSPLLYWGWWPPVLDATQAFHQAKKFLCLFGDKGFAEIGNTDFVESECKNYESNSISWMDSKLKDRQNYRNYYTLRRKFIFLPW